MIIVVKIRIFLDFIRKKRIEVIIITNDYNYIRIYYWFKLQRVNC